MILAEFYQGTQNYWGFCVSGHAGYAKAGEDVVCAGVSSAVQLTINAVCEICLDEADVAVEENRIVLQTSRDAKPATQLFIKALWLHLTLLSEQYPNTIKLYCTKQPNR